MPTGRQRYCSHECYSGTLRVPISDRFWTKVNKNGPIARPGLTPCWLWTAGTSHGYGEIVHTVNGKRGPVFAHRVSWELTYGFVPELCVCHQCDQPLCVRPDHLFLGTDADNLQDARNKGRLDEKRPRRAKLTYEQRLAIFRRPDQLGIGVLLAREYGVTEACISKIRCGHFARHRDQLASVLQRVPHVVIPSMPVRGEVA